MRGAQRIRNTKNATSCQRGLHPGLPHTMRRHEEAVLPQLTVLRPCCPAAGPDVTISCGLVRCMPEWPCARSAVHAAQQGPGKTQALPALLVRGMHRLVGLVGTIRPLAESNNALDLGMTRRAAGKPQLLT